MGNCANHCRFSNQPAIHHQQTVNNPFPTPRLKNRKNQIILKPLCYLSAPKQTNINTSNTRASTQRPASLVDVIDEYNHQARVVQNQKLHQELNLRLTESYYIQAPSYTIRSTVLNRQTKKGKSPNISGMGSPNISGMGSPNISGIKQKVGGNKQAKEIAISKQEIKIEQIDCV